VIKADQRGKEKGTGPAQFLSGKRKGPVQSSSYFFYPGFKKEWKKETTKRGEEREREGDTTMFRHIRKEREKKGGDKKGKRVALTFP